MNGLPLALSLAIASAAAYAAGAVMQERLAAAQTGSTGTGAGRAQVFGFLATYRWWISVACNGAGGALHVLALAYGSLSVVQPLGALTLVLALPLGAAAGGRRATRRQWWGAVATVAGLAVVLGLTVPGADEQGLDPGEAMAVTGAATVVILGLALALRLSDRPAPRSVLAAVASGIAFAVASALTEPLTEQVTADGPVGLVSPLTLALAGMASAGLLLSQLAYRDSGLGAPLATQTLANPVASVVIALVVLGERTAGGLWGAAVALVCATVAAWGVVLLAEPRQAPAPGRARRSRGARVPSVRAGVTALEPQPAYRGAGPAANRPGDAPARATGPAGADGRVRRGRGGVGRRLVRPVRRRCETAWRRSWGRRRRRVG
ncbi:DMT family transporter [Micromonospora sp. NPDC049559]|uniref:DMT family transporter n=1 Tax=Micromonospora sp. NPDC049559 TaxID=3155923 RepID=UPI0034403822